MTKSCSKCKAVKPLKAFHKDASQTSGYKSRCAECSPRARREAIKLSETLPETFVPVAFTPPDVGFDYDDIVIEVDEPVEEKVTVPEGFGVKGTSTLYDADGNVRAKWVKTNRQGTDKFQAFRDAMATIADKWTGLADPAIIPDMLDDDLLAVYPMGDPHIGMFGWAAETGNDFDLKIAEHNLYTAVDHLVDLAPAAEHALVVNVGDFFHADNRASTTTSGTPVDSDGRWPKVLSVGIRLMRRVIDRALTKHKHVTVINEIGNHDWHGSIMLSICLAQYYEREPRVTIDTSPAKFHWHRFGNNLIGVTHGDTAKLADLGEIMSCDRAQDWGETMHRYWLTGHIHHDTVKELRGCTVESFRTLAPGDAWHRGKGYRSGRDMKVLVFHREHGQINRHVVGINQINGL